MTYPAEAVEQLSLPARWHALRYHREQCRLWGHPARFKTIHAGRRSGKSELAKRKLAMSLRDCLNNPLRTWPDPRFFAGGPTRDQAKKIFWNDLKRLVPKSWVRRVYDGDLCLVTHWDAELWVMGLDKPARLEGPGWDGGVIDEFADCRAGIFDNNLRPALADRKGWLWMLGVPDFAGPSQAEYEAFCEIGASGQDPEWADFTWPSSDILDPVEVESMKRQMSLLLFEQETGGRFVMKGGRAVPDFGPDNQSAERAVYDPALPICWSLDFNVDPMCSGVIQHHQGQVRVIDELVLSDVTTPAACEAFLERAAERKWDLSGLRVYGDASGNSRRTVGATAATTDWYLVKNALRAAGVGGVVMRVPLANPPIKDTVNSLNARVRTADGTVNLYVHPRCKQIIGDLKAAVWPSDMSEQHALAWLRYFVQREYPVLPARPKADRSNRIIMVG